MEEDSLLIGLGFAVGVALLYLGGRIRARSRNRPRPPGDGSS
jgi:hypothetical protein